VRDTPRAKNRKSEEKYVGFFYMVERAMAESEVRAIGIITAAQKEDWRGHYPKIQ